MPSVAADRGVIYLGLDVHKNTITAGVLEPGSDTPVIDTISSDEDWCAAWSAGSTPGAGAGLLRGRSDRVRAGPAARVAGGALRGDRPVVDPDRPG